MHLLRELFILPLYKRAGIYSLPICVAKKQGTVALGLDSEFKNEDLSRLHKCSLKPSNKATSSICFSYMLKNKRFRRKIYD